MPRRLLIALLLSALLSGLGPPTAARAAATAHPRARPNAVSAPAPATPSGARMAQPAATGAGTPFGHIPCDLYNAYAATPIAGADDGTGQTIAVIDPYGTPSVATDFAAFSQAFGLGGPPLRVVAPNGVDLTQPDAPGQSPAWIHEIPLDVEWAHAMAPAAQVVLVEARTSTAADLLAAIDYAVNTVSADVVNMSWTFDESAGQYVAYDARFPETNGAGRGITFFAAAGDVSSTAAWPAVSPNVIAVGGTSVTSAGFAGADTGAHACPAAPSPPYAPGNESAWASSGGGPSAFEPQPAYQSGLAPGSARVTPDVAMLADPTTGVALYAGGAWATSSWGGTSLAAPLWAGLTSRLNQVRRGNQDRVGWLYASYRATGSHAGFNDVPPAGYDVPTGLGSPLFASLKNAATAPPESAFQPQTPARILDSRTTKGGHPGRFAPGESFTLPVVPAVMGATAAVLNVGVTDMDGAASGYVLVSAADEPRPTASTVNVVAGQTVANLAQVKLSRAGSVTIYNAAGYLNVFIDLEGYYYPSVPAPGQGLYSALPAPARRLDTRKTNTPLGAGQTVRVQVAGWTDPATHLVPVPASASAVVVNLTEVGGDAPSYLAAWPDGTSQPPVSNLNFPAGRVIANRAIVQVRNGYIDVYNSAGTAHVLVDLAGWFSGGGPGDAAGARFLPVTPSRIFDTRTGLGGRSTPLGGGESARVPVAASSAAAAALNVTGLDAGAFTYIGVYPGAPSAQPTSSDINLGPGDILPNHAVTGLTGSAFYLYNSAGSVKVFVDLAGFYA